MEVVRPNQVWAMDITYIPMAKGFVYLAVVLDWFSRRVLSWRISITMEASFCVETLEDALARHGRPEIFNTDQGSQFTGAAFTSVLIKNDIAISMPLNTERDRCTAAFLASGNLSLALFSPISLPISYMRKSAAAMSSTRTMIPTAAREGMREW